MHFSLKKFFRKNFFSIHFWQTSDYWSLWKNAFAVQLWSPALYRRNIMHFSHKKFFSVKIFFYSLLTNVRLLKATENAFAAKLWSPALYWWKIMHFSLKKFFRKNFFLFTFDKRQTIEVYEKIHSQFSYGLRRYTDEI